MFGSRITLVAKKLSDVDLFYNDVIPCQILGKIEEDFEESDLPYKIDIVNYHQCDTVFKKILMKKYVVLPNCENKLEHPIYFTSIPEAMDTDFLTQKINQETPEFGEAHSFAFFMRDERNQIIAGCNGSVIFSSIYTDQLWVHQDHSKNSLGRKLMEIVHDYGRKSGCSMATAATMSFQGASAFYEKLGYVVDFERPGYTQNSSCIFLRLSL